MAEGAYNGGWVCPACTFINRPARPGCEMCATDRPEGYKPNASLTADKKSLRAAIKSTYEQLIACDTIPIAGNTETFECIVCFTEVQKNTGIKLHNCLHEFCRGCVVETIENSPDIEVKCPYRDNQYKCDQVIQDREVRALLLPDSYTKHIRKSLSCAEGQIRNSFHCKTPNCDNWCVFERGARKFTCPACKKTNCIPCQAIHEGKSCSQYKRYVEANKPTEEKEAERLTEQHFQNLIRNGEAMKCPDCDFLIMKSEGCDAMRCHVCKLQICWATKGRRWGPQGEGDTSAGCRCTDERPCSRDCSGCDIPHEDFVEMTENLLPILQALRMLLLDAAANN